MGIGSIIAIFFVVWWIVIFAVLPWGVRTQEEEGEVVLGTTPSAPAIIAGLARFLSAHLFAKYAITKGSDPTKIISTA